MHSTTTRAPLDADSVVALGDTLCVWAHPDDETYLCGATMAALRDAGHRVVCITATRGEQGGQGPTPWLRALRTVELQRALAVLDVDEHLWLDLPDGGCAEVDPAGPVSLIHRLLREVRPRTVLTFAPDGMTGHPDHIAVGAWTAAAFAAAAVDGAQLLEAAVTEDHLVRFGGIEERLGVNVGERALPTPFDALAVHAVFRDDALERKVHALAQQASQTTELRAAFGEERFRDWIAPESFRPVAR